MATTELQSTGQHGEHASQATIGVICEHSRKLFGSSFRTEIRTSQIFRAKKIPTDFTQILPIFNFHEEYDFQVSDVNEHVAMSENGH